MMLKPQNYKYKGQIVSEREEFSSLYQNIMHFLQGQKISIEENYSLVEEQKMSFQDIIFIKRKYADKKSHKIDIELTASKTHGKSRFDSPKDPYGLRLSISLRETKEPYTSQLEKLSRIYGLEKESRLEGKDKKKTTKPSSGHKAKRGEYDEKSKICESGNCMLVKEEELSNIYQYEIRFTTEKELGEYIKKYSKKTFMVINNPQKEGHSQPYIAS